MRTLKIVNQNKKILLFLFLLLVVINTSFAVHVYEVVEVSFTAKIKYDNPYMDVNFDVTLNGPGDKSGADGQRVRDDNVPRRRVTIVSEGESVLDIVTRCRVA